MDGIPVKISERYKPPKKIVLPVRVQNRINNTHINLDEYDFSLERTVAERVAQLKEVRRRKREDRERAKESEREAAEADLARGATTTEGDMLTPVPIAAATARTEEPPPGKGPAPINLSDFEWDTSSPFDNVELKTINDIEELARVLEATPRPPPAAPDTAKQPPAHHRPDAYPNGMVGGATCWPGPPPWQPPPYATTAAIMRSLQTSLQTRRAAAAVQPPSNTSATPLAGGASLPLRREDDDGPSKMEEEERSVLAKLSPEARSVAKSAKEMGFPTARAARATLLFDNDQSKVIEFLVQAQKLEEIGPRFSDGEKSRRSDRVENALVANDYNFDVALDYLRSVKLLLEFGFDERQVVEALAKFNNDRDRALDYLIS